MFETDLTPAWFAVKMKPRRAVRPGPDRDIGRAECHKPTRTLEETRSAAPPVDPETTLTRTCATRRQTSNPRLDEALRSAGTPQDPDLEA